MSVYLLTYLLQNRLLLIDGEFGERTVGEVTNLEGHSLVQKAYGM